jgi:hypothetical protein
MSNLDPRIEAVRQTYGLEHSDFWQIPQNKQWVCKHAALEVVAARAKIEWQQPVIIQADTASGIAVLSVAGKMGERLEWSTGEASPKNNKNNYPWAMAEKRAKDRVVLKLVGIHGLVYSEDEMPPEENRTTDQRSDAGRREVQRQQSQTQDGDTAKKDLAARTLYATLEADMRKCKSKDDLRRWIADPEVKALRSKLPADWDVRLRQEAADLGNSLDAPLTAPPERNAYRDAVLAG